MAALLSCVEYELSKTSDLFRQAGLEETFQRVSQVCASLRTKIQDAEYKQLFDMQLKRWMKHIVDVCYDMMYVLDELNLQEAGTVRVFSHRFSFFSHHNRIYSLGVRHKLREIVSRFGTLAAEANRFHISVSLENWDVSSQQRQLDPFLPPSVPIGRPSDTHLLLKLLLDNDGDAEEEDIRFISVVGMAGIGKTTLAKLVYNDDKVIASFGYRAWVSVSQEFNLRKIVMAILGFSTSDLMNDVEMEFLILEFRRVIAGKRCLIVLDDIGGENPERWQLIKEFFNFCVAGSRILITTRNPLVSSLTSKYRVSLRVLGEEDSWDIIHTAFGSLTYSDFRPMLMNITNKCRGVPLYLRSLAAIMRYKRSKREFEKMLDSQIWEVAHEIGMEPLLMVFYSQLPSYLKQCLLYCSIFPKDHIIVTDKLIQLWIAQGFIHSDDNHLEEEGRRIFNGLLGYSIFNGVIQHGIPGSTCQLEGGISALNQVIAENEYHRMLLDSGEKPIEEHDVPRNCRHCTLTIAPHTGLPESIPNAEKLHTLMILSEYSSVDTTNLSQLLSNLRRVRALILSSCSIEELPAKVGKLFHLRYLDLSFNHDLKHLPGVICNLINLQTLNLNGCRSLRKLPKGIGKLIKLRHLEILWTTSLSYLPKGIACLTSLRTLSRFFGNSLVGSKACNIGDLEKLNNIQGNITIDGLGAETDASDAERAGLENKNGLRGLELWFTAPGAGTKDERVLGALKAPPELEDLGIFYYRGNLFPTWMIALQKLTHLTLADCDKCSVLSSLGELSSLESLKIINMPGIKKVVDSEFLRTGSTGAFPKLKTLSFQKLDNWEEWVGLGDDGVQANFMPLLSSLSIVNCRKLEAIPGYLKLKKDEKPGFHINIKKCPSLEQTQYE